MSLDPARAAAVAARGRGALRALGLAAALLPCLTIPVAAQTATAPAFTLRETIEADVSTRSIAVESDFSGTRVVIFGTVENSRQTSANDGYYDIAVVIAGPREELLVRRKSRVAGIWINTDSLGFDDIPSYYTVVSTKPLAGIAPRPVLYQHGIGFDYLRLAAKRDVPTKELEAYRDSVMRIKRSQSLYREEPMGVAFIGKSLFRSTIDLPANVSLGEFTVWIYLFHDGQLLNTYKTRLDLQREGVERTIYNFAMDYPLYYGLAAVAMATIAGLLASTLFRKD